MLNAEETLTVLTFERKGFISAAILALHCWLSTRLLGLNFFMEASIINV